MDRSIKLNNNQIESYKKNSISFLENKYPNFCANNLDFKTVKLYFIVILFSLIILFVLNGKFAIELIMIVGNFLFLVTILFKLSLIIIGYFIYQLVEKRKKTTFHHILLSDIDLPIYSILVPIYQEEKIIPGLIKALDNISYPKDKLDILLLVEENDTDTIAAINQQKLESCYKLIIIPDFSPKTKPKACNYGLNFATGKYITIYDAEDIPESFQLKKVVEKFNNLPKEYICVQAKLNFYNRNENILSKFFSIEYSNLFEFLLPAMSLLNYIIPLGGTSNHFKREKLLEIGAWDPYNVTEDAELGIRLKLLGYKTDIIDSTTMEESPIRLKDWIPQRTRWIKGYFITYFIALKNTKQHLSKMSLWQIIGFHLFVGFPQICYVIAPFHVAIHLLTRYGDFDSYFISESSLLLCKISFITMVISSFLSAIISTMHHKWFNMIIITFIFPYYWILHIYATYRAIYQLFHDRFHWEKTNHGITSFKI